jgi:hypothetical protein
VTAAASRIAAPAVPAACRWCGLGVHLRQCGDGWYWVHVDGGFPCRPTGVHRATYAEPCPVHELAGAREVSHA